MKQAPELLELEHLALFLDFDGTLARLQPRPDDVKPEPHRNHLLKKLSQRLNGRLAIISGRTIDTLDYLADHSVIALAGVHGLQRRTAAGKRDDVIAPASWKRCVNEVKKLQEYWPTIIVEEKEVSIALHYRQSPDAKDALIHAAKKIAEQFGSSLQAGHKVIEVRVPGPDKGEAIFRFMQEAPFKGKMPIFVGDDLTDESGFAMAQSLGGFGVRVGEGESSAQYALADVDAVLTWLEESTNEHA